MAPVARDSPVETATRIREDWKPPTPAEIAAVLNPMVSMESSVESNTSVAETPVPTEATPLLVKVSAAPPEWSS